MERWHMFAMRTIREKRLSVKMRKKGMSPIVATLGLLLITVAAVGFIAPLVYNLVKTNLNESTECIGFEEYFTFYEEFDYNCYAIVDDRTKNYSVTAVSVEADTVSPEKVENIAGFKLIFRGPGQEELIDVTEGVPVEKPGLRMLKFGETELSVPSGGGVKTYVLNYTEGGAFETVEIYPLLKNERICEKTDSMRVYFCATDVPLSV